MNSNTVLSKIMTLLSLSKEDVELAFARLSDGTILESPTFDVGETVEVVGEDGTKTPAPDGEHELELTDEEGNINRFKIFTTDGVITERENVELEAETVEVEPLPNTTDEDEANKVEMSETEEFETQEAVDEEKQDLPSVDVVELEKRISAMEATLMEIKEKIAEEVVEVVEEMIEGETEMEEDEEEDDKLDGAPLEMSKLSFKPTKSVKSSQNLFLTKLYK